MAVTMVLAKRKKAARNTYSELRGPGECSNSAVDKDVESFQLIAPNISNIAGTFTIEFSTAAPFTRVLWQILCT